jgi:hypothetical protein
MSVVVRRADVAELTTVEVERLVAATPTSANSDWMQKAGPSTTLAASTMKALSKDPMYAKSHARVVASEVWARTLPHVQSSRGEHPNLLAALDPALGDRYADITALRQDIASLATQIEQEKTAGDAPDVTPADKKNHQDAVAKLEQARSSKEADVAPMQTAFLASLKPAAAKVPAAQQAKFAPALANLLQALDDADTSNSAAIIRYPLALRSLPDSVKAMVPVIAADVVEEKTGKRPDLAHLKPEVSLHGTDVTITLAGLSPADIGRLDMGAVTKEVISRSSKWAVHALTLLGTVNSTKETISFEHDVLAEILAGFDPSATSNVTAVTIPAADSPAVAGADAAPRVASLSRPLGRGSNGAAGATSAKAKERGKSGGAAGRSLATPATSAPGKRSPERSPAGGDAAGKAKSAAL